MARGQSPFQGRYVVPQVDFSPIAQAGRDWGQAFAGFGRDMGGMVKERKALKGKLKGYQKSVESLEEYLPFLLEGEETAEPVKNRMQELRQMLNASSDMNLKEKVAAYEQYMPTVNTMLSMSMQKMMMDKQYPLSGYEQWMKAKEAEQAARDAGQTQTPPGLPMVTPQTPPTPPPGTPTPASRVTPPQPTVPDVGADVPDEPSRQPVIPSFEDIEASAEDDHPFPEALETVEEQRDDLPGDPGPKGAAGLLPMTFTDFLRFGDEGLDLDTGELKEPVISPADQEFYNAVHKYGIKLDNTTKPRYDAIVAQMERAREFPEKELKWRRDQVALAQSIQTLNTARMPNLDEAGAAQSLKTLKKSLADLGIDIESISISGNPTDGFDVTVKPIDGPDLTQLMMPDPNGGKPIPVPGIFKQRGSTKLWHVDPVTKKLSEAVDVEPWKAAEHQANVIVATMQDMWKDPTPVGVNEEPALFGTENQDIDFSEFYRIMEIKDMGVGQVKIDALGILTAKTRPSRQEGVPALNYQFNTRREWYKVAMEKYRNYKEMKEQLAILRKISGGARGHPTQKYEPGGGRKGGWHGPRGKAGPRGEPGVLPEEAPRRVNHPLRSYDKQEILDQIRRP